MVRGTDDHVGVRDDKGRPLLAQAQPRPHPLTAVGVQMGCNGAQGHGIRGGQGCLLFSGERAESALQCQPYQFAPYLPAFLVAF